MNDRPLQERKPLQAEIQLLRSERQIKRLRAEIERLQSTVDDISNLRDEYALKRKPLQAEIEQHIREKIELAGMLAKARDKIERMRAAIQAYIDYWAPEEELGGEPILLQIRRQLRAALNAQGNDK